MNLYRFTSPVGPIGLIWTSTPEPKLVRIALAKQLTLQTTAALPEILHPIEETILQRLTSTDIAPAEELLNWSELSDFRYKLIHSLLTIPRGQVITYGDLAERAGHPGSSRAAGGAMAANPFPLLYPCHRIVAAGHRLGGYGGGQGLKTQLLQLEGVTGYS